MDYIIKYAQTRNFTIQQKIVNVKYAQTRNFTIRQKIVNVSCMDNNVQNTRL